MFENIPVKVDSVGRMVIPKNIRKMYNIDKNSLLEKLTRLEKHNFCFVVMKNEKCLYKTNSNDFLPPDVISSIFNNDSNLGSVSMTINNIRSTYYYFIQRINKYTKFLIFVYSSDEKSKDKIYTICNLFCK